MFKVNNKDTKTTPMNIFHIFVLVFLLLTLNMLLPAGFDMIWILALISFHKRS